jgi:hypothetical protein
VITHIGVLTLAPTATDDQRTAITEGLAALVGQVEGLVSARTATGLGIRPGTADVIFEMTFSSREAWEAYGDHPLHKAIVTEHIGPVLQDKVFLQTEGFSEATA